MAEIENPGHRVTSEGFPRREPFDTFIYLFFRRVLSIGNDIWVIEVLKRELDAVLGIFAFPQGVVAVLVGS